MMMKAALLASVLAAVVTIGVADAADAPKVQSVTGVYETPRSTDLKNEPLQPPWVLESMAHQVAAYMKAHRGAELRLAGAGEQRATTVDGSGIRDRRISAIRTALIKAGVPAASIRVGPR